ncbi:hypothetical protein IM543_07070 [Massilia sp. UMI-21]|nr:hypothetical protein IM543_07070 [Massilia sp. UMI-21]
MAVAKTKSSEVVDKLNNVLEEGKYADSNSFAMRAILRDCEQVRAVDPAHGWSLLGCYHTLLGDEEEVERCFRASQNLMKSPHACSNYHTNLTNLGFFSRAHAFYKANGNPESGNFSMISLIGFLSGSFQTFVSYYDRAVAMNMELPQYPITQLRRVAELLSRAGWSDEMTTRHMDAAGLILRRHRLLCSEDSQVDVVDEPGVFQGVTCAIPLQMNAEKVFELNMELAAAEEELQVEKSPVFDVMFLSA